MIDYDIPRDRFCKCGANDYGPKNYEKRRSIFMSERIEGYMLLIMKANPSNSSLSVLFGGFVLGMQLRVAVI